eukprot:gene5790-8855_t
MTAFASRLCVLVLLAAPPLTHAALPLASIAVIGGGFSGSSTAYYLNKLCEGCYNVTVFEAQPQVGGRVGHVVLPNSTIAANTGGDAWSECNYYLMDLMYELPIQNDNGGYPTQTAELWEGPGNGWLPLPVNKTLDKHAWWDALASVVDVAAIQAALTANYAERGGLLDGKPFDSVAEFAAYGRLDAFSNVSMHQILTRQGFDERMVADLAVPLSRAIYDQNLSLNGFAGMAVLLSAATPEYSSVGGNDQVVKSLLAAAGVNLRAATAIRAVAYTDDHSPHPGKTELGSSAAAGTFALTTSANETHDGFDVVVLASPIEAAGEWTATGFTPIAWSFPLPPLKMRTYHHWYVVYAIAEAADPSYFETSGPVPDAVLTPENTTAPFVQLATRYQLPSGLKAFEFFSNAPLDDKLNDMFTGLQWNKTIVYPATFPNLAPDPANYQPNKLHPSVYYPNALESMAVAMEISVIGGRNAAMQIHRDVKNRLKREK